MTEPTPLGRILAASRASGDFAPLVEAIPFARFLGIRVERDAERLVSHMQFAPHQVGNALIPALHGGTLGALLESAAVFELLWESRKTPENAKLPRIVNITVEYLRSARTIDTHAAAEITRQGRRVATVRAYAWQEDREKPVAVANAHFLLADGAS